MLLKQHKVRHVVINPGATNIQLAQLIQRDPFFTCYSVVDERSAMYFAIGLYLELGLPIATTCTSAQATRNYIPGLTEAYYKHVPILAITASKLPAYKYQEYMQQPDQTSLPKDAVKRSYPLPFVCTKTDELMCERMVNEAILELTHRTAGPVQLNMPVDDEVIRAVVDASPPEVKTIHRFFSHEDWHLSLNEKKILLVIGEHRPFSKEETTAIENFAESNNVAIYVNHLSNYHGKYTLHGNLALTVLQKELFLQHYKPDILVTLEGQTGDYPLFNCLSLGDKFAYEHWRISAEGSIADTYNKLTKVFECRPEAFFKRFTSDTPSEHSYHALWTKLSESVEVPKALPFSTIWAAQQLHKLIPKYSNLNFAILNSLRSWNFFPLDKTITCYSNVAAFGIDGCMSVLLGQSVATRRLCFLVIGDLAFFYDMNSLGIRHLGNNIRILLLNNGGGTEFKLSGDRLSREVLIDPYIAAFGHNKGGARGWAESCGFRYLSASSEDDFLNHRDEFLADGERSIVFEVFTTPQNESEALNLIYSSNRIENNTRALVRAVIGEKGVNLLKGVLKR